MVSEFSKLAIVTAAVAQLLLLLACNSLQTNMHPDPKSALERFYSFQGMEEELMDMLILAGDDVVPLVLTEIQNKDMPRRRYAIGFLGNGRYTQALPVLQKILEDPNEKDYFRGDALLSIYRIDSDLGLRLANEHGTDEDVVGSIAQDILKGVSYIDETRTYLDASHNLVN